MSNFTDFISSGGGAADKLDILNPVSGQKAVIRKSMSYTPAINCTAIVTCIGAGGGGGASGSGQAVSTGGAAGGVCQSELSLTAGTTYTITVGAGGAGGTTTTSSANGVTGGTTSFTGSNITDMTATGGTQGKHTTQSTTSSAGGTGSGGSIVNRTGGGTSVPVAAVAYGCTGGAALGFFENGKSVTTTGASVTRVDAAGIDIPPIDVVPQLKPELKAGAGAPNDQLDLMVATASDGDFGCGGGFAYNDRTTGGHIYANGGAGGIGAGGGSAYARNTNSSETSTGGKGGDGMIILEFV
jgi:hypothetical protein